MSSPTLMKAFDFTGEELLLNQEGVLSERQEAEIRKEGRQQSFDLGCALLVMVLVAGLALGACGLIFNLRVLYESASGLLQVGGIALGVLVVVVLIVNWLGARERRRKFKKPVAALEGALKLSEESGGFNARYYLEIAGERFRIESSMFDVLVDNYGEDTTFRVYYHWKTHRLLSLEAESDYDTPRIDEGDDT